jgi:hypothetical protein
MHAAKGKDVILDAWKRKLEGVSREGYYMNVGPMARPAFRKPSSRASTREAVLT